MPSFTLGTPSRWLQLSVIAAACQLIAPHAVRAADPAPNAAVGQQLAEQYCVECHVVSPSGKSGWTDAPAFDAIANRPDTTLQTLSTIIERPHLNMMNTGRPPEEARDIAAYIMGLRKR